MAHPTDKNSHVIRLCMVALVMAVCVIGGCKRQAASPSTPSSSSSPSNSAHFDIIKAAITRMLERPEGAFLIVEESGSGKFVQFAGSRDEALILDLPLQTLAAEEVTKARAVFAEMGYSDAIPAQGDSDAGDAANSQWQSATVSFDDDVDGAAKLAVAVLHRVYGFDETVKLELTEE